MILSGERDDWQHPEHVERHEHGPPPAEPNPGQDQLQGEQRHHEGQDGQRACGCADEIRSLSVPFLWRISFEFRSAKVTFGIGHLLPI